MARSWGGRLAAVGVLGLTAAGLVWWINRSTPIPSTPPANAPKVGACYAVPPAVARGPLPWPGSPVPCGAAHTAEVYHVGQVDHDLISRSRGKGDDAKVATNLMFAEVRRACGAIASGYLGGDWHRDQVTLLANWITPARDGFFGCALAQVTGPGGADYVTRTGTLKGAGDSGPLAIGCVARTGDSVRYASCTDEHSGEFVGAYRITPDNAPFDAKVVASAVTKGCGQVALTYLGLPATATRPDLNVGYVGPTTAETWLGSDQTFACYASASTPLRGTVRNLGTRPLPD
jgi:Septum formation